MILKNLALKFPSCFIAGAIFFGSTMVFLLWLVMGGDREREQKKGPTVASAPAAFVVSDVVLCGNTLVNFKTGKVIAKEWLEGFGSRAPSVRKLWPDENLALISGDSGMVQAFGFDGKPKPMLQVDGKFIGQAGYNGSATEVIYVRDGDLFHGKANWLDSRVESPRKVTDTGYFRRDTFQGGWLWHEDDLLVTLLGKTLAVKLADGQVKEQPANLAQLEKGMSPCGTYALAQAGGRELHVLDMVTGALKSYDVGQWVGKFLWLTNDRVVIKMGHDEFALYEHSKKAVDGPRSFDGPVADIGTRSPDGNCFLAVGQSKITILDLKAKKNHDLKIPFSYGEWVNNEAMLCSCSAVDTDKRGLWLVTKTGETERLSNQPIDSMRSNGSTLPQIVRTPDLSLFVTNGDLWSYAMTSKTLKKITDGEKLPPFLQFLK